MSPARPKGYVPTPSRDLQQRIAKHGVVDPVAVRPLGLHRYEILSNPTTWVAAGRAGLRQVPVTVHEGLSGTEAAGIVADHYQSASINPIDEALGFEEDLEELGGRGRRGAVTALAVRLGQPRSYVAHSLRLLELPAEIQKQVKRGELSAGQARPLITVTGAAQQVRLARKIIAEGLSVRQVEKLANECRDPGTAPAPAAVAEPTTPNADVQRLEQRVTELVGSPFQIRGKEAVFNFFGDYEVLDGLLRRLGYRDD